MKLDFLRLPSDERRLYIEQAALRRNVTPVLLEMDFWNPGRVYGCSFPHRTFAVVFRMLSPVVSKGRFTSQLTGGDLNRWPGSCYGWPAGCRSMSCGTGRRYLRDAFAKERRQPHGGLRAAGTLEDSDYS
jgi:hypothetical protein